MIGNVIGNVITLDLHSRRTDATLRQGIQLIIWKKLPPIVPSFTILTTLSLFSDGVGDLFALEFLHPHLVQF